MRRPQNIFRSLLVVSVLAVSMLLFGGKVQASSPEAKVSPSKPYEEVIKLWNAKFSEKFIRNKIASDGTVYELSADELVNLKTAGVPESLIEFMMETRRIASASSATPPPPAVVRPSPAVPSPVVVLPQASALPVAPAAAPAVPVAVVAPAPPPVVPPAPAASVSNPPPPRAAAPAPAPPVLPAAPPVPEEPMKSQTFSGLSLKNSGVVVFKRRWDSGTLTVKDGKVYWVCEGEEHKNFILPFVSIKEQFLTCEKSPVSQGACFEWGIRTADNTTYRFRDVSWEHGSTKKPVEVFDFMRSVVPNLLSSKFPGDRK